MPLSSSTVATTSMLFTALPGVADFTNDARWVAFIHADAGGKYGLYLQDTNTGTVRQIATPADASSLERPIFSDDGNKLVFSAHSSVVMAVS